MIEFALRLLLVAALYFVVVWCLFGAWTWYERDRLWRGLRRR